MRVLITGGCGFVGSSLALMLKVKYPSYDIICFDNLKRRGSELNVSRLVAQKIQFIHGDIRNFDELMATDGFDAVIDAAAEPSVLAGLNDNGLKFVTETNINGTVNLLKLALMNKANFIFLSTSRVYPIAPLEAAAFSESATRFDYSPIQSIAGISSKGISEECSLQGARSIYGSTKLASELMVQEFNELMGLKTVTNRCGVLAGSWQWGKVDQGFMTLWVAKHFWNKSLTYNGYGGLGKQIRDVLHVADLFRLIDEQLHHIDRFNGGCFNVGGGNAVSTSLMELTALCQKVTGNQIPITPVPENRIADLRMYVSDTTKLAGVTNWKPEYMIADIVDDVYSWIKNNESQLVSILS